MSIKTSWLLLTVLGSTLMRISVAGDIATALSDPTGHFILTGVPSGANVPIVVQLGKWRRQTSIPMVNGCIDNPLTDPNLTRLPKNQMEGPR